MNIDHLKYVLEVERSGSISQAAKALYLNQPYLSKVINEVEEELNVKIFERSNKGVQVTYRGREVLNRIAHIMDEVDDLDHLYTSGDKKPFRFNVAVPTASYVAEAFKQFVSKRDFKHGCVMSYHETDTVETIELITKGEYDLGVIRVYDFDDQYYSHLFGFKNLEAQIIDQFEMKLLMSVNHYLSQKDQIKLKDLKDSLMLLHGDIRLPGHTIGYIREFLKKAHINKTIKIYERASQLQLLESVPNSLMFVSPMPQDILDRYHLMTRTCSDFSLKAKDILIYRQGYTQSIEDQMFVDYLKQTIRSLS